MTLFIESFFMKYYSFIGREILETVHCICEGQGYSIYRLQCSGFLQGRLWCFFFFSGVYSCVLHTFELEGVGGIKVSCQVFLVWLCLKKKYSLGLISLVSN